MTTKLDIFNGALVHLGERSLSSLSENTPARYDLDAAWDSGVVDFCLREGLWTFAARVSKFSAATDIEPEFGYSFAFELPDDFIKLDGLFTDEYLRIALQNFQREQNFLFCASEEIYMRYISNDASFGGNYSIWPDDFKDYVQTYLAFKACMKITGSDKTYLRLEKQVAKYKLEAKSRDSFEKPTRYPARSNWTRARLSGSTGIRDNGTFIDG